MKLFQEIKITFLRLFENKGRFFLTILGIIIGTASLIVIMAVGAGAGSLITNQIKEFGTDTIGILPGKSEEGGPPSAVMGIAVTTLKYEDFEAVKKLPHIKYLSAIVQGLGPVIYKDKVLDLNFIGTTIDYFKVHNVSIDTGRFFTPDEEKNLGRVAIIGADIKQDLFGQNDAVGKRIKIKNESFETIGVLKGGSKTLFFNNDNTIFIPISSGQKLLLGINHISVIRGKVDNVANLDIAKTEIEKTLRQRHNIKNPNNDDFTIRTALQALEIFTKITNALRYFLAAIAAVSLVVGGIGIMNIMLVTVTERTHEVGLRKALGASYKNILSQFLFEAVIITAIGGIIGIILGLLISALIALIAKGLGYNWSFVVSLLGIVVASGISILIGLVFGVYPARKAAKLDPIKALRYE